MGNYLMKKFGVRFLALTPSDRVKVSDVVMAIINRFDDKEQDQELINEAAEKWGALETYLMEEYEVELHQLFKNGYKTSVTIDDDWNESTLEEVLDWLEDSMDWTEEE